MRRAPGARNRRNPPSEQRRRNKSRGLIYGWRQIWKLRSSGTGSEGVDFSIRVMPRETSAAIIAPHGGMIEPGTSDIAAAIAGNDYGLYCFEGLRDRPHRDLHITSANFREPKCVELVAGCDLVVAVHGLDG